MTVGWSTAGFANVAALVRERTGLIFPDARMHEVEATIRRTMARLSISDPDKLIALLRDDNAARELFVADLTIGESYFQRDPSQFGLLRSRILPELIASRPADRPVRVWSAGCASGEEPYTMAMLFEELDAADRCDIVGTDIARHRLEDAQRGIFSKWQLRSTPEPIRRRYFTERGRFFELSPRIRQRVDFRYLNLAEDSFPSLTTGIWGMDVILCRNVLIYFDAPTVERVAQRLIASLSEEGWLLLGASDPAISEMVDCDVVLTDSGLVYRRKGVAGFDDIRMGARARADMTPPAPAAESHEPVHIEVRRDVDADERSDRGNEFAQDERTGARGEVAPEDRSVARSDVAPDDRSDAGRDVPTEDRSGHAVSDAILSAYERRDFQQLIRLADGAPAGASLTAAAWTVWVRALANEGRHEAAAGTVKRAIDRVGATAELLYLHAVLLLQAGRPADAAASARSALYLDPALVVAHLTLGDAHRHLGNRSGERRAFRNAATHLAALDPEAVVPASDGEKAGRMGELVRVKLSLLGDS
ncbi:MAG: protein-glutamate O-methyltransferase CheR [Gemmatimonadetes bacterium]|nr:protein-glutamate O-methyltransferase CheR [Gemmatimonadota bacterium]